MDDCGGSQPACRASGVMDKARSPASTRAGGSQQRTPVVPLPLDAIPRATYRLQLHRDFTFADVIKLVPYLADLGISHVYCSPYLRARPGSLHGYDIVDHRTLNPEIGTSEDFQRMVETLARHGMNHVCDVVPNHMAIMGEDNAWWMDVLENGGSSAYAEFFDIDWEPQDAELRGKVLVPVLGDPYGAVLERGELALAFEPAHGTFAVRYFSHRFPLDPRTCAPLLVQCAVESCDVLDAEAMDELRAVSAALAALPARDETDGARVDERRRVAGECAIRLGALMKAHPALVSAVERVVARTNGIPGTASSFDSLHALLEAQAYRLAFWRVASDEINYRRFFDINELAGLRMENHAVFDATHRYVLEVAARGDIGALRIDHPDGLLDPARYFNRLQERYRELAIDFGTDDASLHGIYVVIEKIAASHERLPESWAVHGTTGYRFLNLVNGLYVDSRARSRLDRAWRAFVGDEAHTFEQACYRGRRAIAEGALASELAVLTSCALRIARADRGTRDFTFNSLREAIKEVAARFPVYRTYVDAEGGSKQDRRYVDWAVARARAKSRASDAAVFDFLHDILLGVAPPGAAPSTAQSVRQFAMRFQQFSAPVAAKGVEDTAFYTFNRFVSLNEVGGDPDQFGIGIRAFHGATADRAEVWPQTMLATSTHDNKRSEDVRARLDVISELPAAWRLTVRRFSRMNRSRKVIVDGQPAPSRNDEYLLYQTLLGTFPPYDIGASELDAYRERIERYMVKAAREAKVHTSWVAENRAYEDALTSFVGGILRGPAGTPFLADLRTQSELYAWFGMLNSVSMALLKVTSPGVPDIYQGNELLDWSLVDPDNRRAVDYDVRRTQLAQLTALAADVQPSKLNALFASPYDGLAKLWVIWRGLGLRRTYPALFARGDYRPVSITGARKEHLVAFARTHEKETIVVVAGRLFASLNIDVGALPVGDAWGDTTLDLAFMGARDGIDVLSGQAVAVARERVPASMICRTFPCALLHFPNTSGSRRTATK